MHINQLLCYIDFISLLRYNTKYKAVRKHYTYKGEYKMHAEINNIIGLDLGNITTAVNFEWFSGDTTIFFGGGM